ncbi:MAG: hypothetical protein AABZ77_07250 [Chloroflexota bacterium]
MGKPAIEKTKEIEIQGDSLDKLYPIITMVANELRFRNNFYEVRLANSNVTDSFAGFAVFDIDPIGMSKTMVGAFTLLLLGSNRIMLRVSPRSRWHHDFDITPLETIKLGLITDGGDEQKILDEQFNLFINSLGGRLRQYGLKVTWYKRLWFVTKELVVIAKAVKS